MYVKNEEDVRHLIEGGTGNSSYSSAHPDVMPNKFEAGTINYLGIAGMSASLSYIEELGMNNIYKHSVGLVKYCHNKMLDIEEVCMYGGFDWSCRVPVLSFNIKNVFAFNVGDILNNNNIEIRTGQHCSPLIHKVINTRLHGTCRISIGHKNNEEEIDEFIDVIKNKVICMKGKNRKKRS